MGIRKKRHFDTRKKEAAEDKAERRHAFFVTSASIHLLLFFL